MNPSPLERHVLVIGGAGYVGSVLVRQLLQAGYRVRVLDQLLYDNGHAIHALLDHPRFSFIRGDFGHTATLGAGLFGITDVILQAALVGDPICKQYPVLAQQVNLESPKRLLEELQGRGIGNFIFTSTCSNYGLRADDTPATESAQLNPQSLYAETKVAFEQHLLSLIDQLDYTPTILRIATAFGISPRMRFDLTVSDFTRAIAMKQALLVYDQHTWRPYCHVADISKAIRLVLTAEPHMVNGEVFNVGSDTNHYTKEMIVALLLQHLPQAAITYRRGSVDPRNYKVAFQHISQKLGFIADYQVPDAIARLLQALHQGFFSTSPLLANPNLYGNYSLDT